MGLEEVWLPILGYEDRHISECATGKRKTAGGYIWSYNSTIEEKE